jgi:putative ABC transport system permease protein
MRGLAAGLVRLISIVVPRRMRDEWRAEWLAELAHAPPERGEDLELLFRVLGALPDAVWLRRRRGSAGMIGSDLSFSLRATARRPSFSLMVVLTLALGIGAATSIFSAVDALLLRPLPFRSPEQLVEILTLMPGAAFGVERVETEPAGEWRAESSVFEGVRAHSARSVVLTGVAEARQLRASLLEPGFLELLGVEPRLGRAFRPEEGIPGRDRVVLLSDGVWRGTFGADPGVLGATVRLNGEPHTVVGVLPRTVRVLPGGIVQIALPLPDTAGVGGRGVGLFARLQNGVSLEAAQAKLDARSAALNASRPREDMWRTQLRPLENWAGRGRRTPLLILFTGVVFLLLIACANAAGLLLLRGMARRHELEIRWTLGASRWSLVRLLLVESLVLVVAAGVLGVALAYAMQGPLLSVMPSGVLRFSYTEVVIDARVLGFAVGVSIFTGLLFGVGPALTSAREGGGPPSTSRTATATRAQGRARSALLLVEVALTMVLLVGAGLMSRSFLRLIGVDPGYRSENLLMLWTARPAHRYRSSESRIAFMEELTTRLRATPGVVGVSVSDGIPPRVGFMDGLELEAEGSSGPPRGQPQLLPHATVDSAYFSVLGIPILEGRAFASEDAGADVAIIDHQLARFLWPDGGAVGKRFRWRAAPEPWVTVVGVAGDVKLMGPDDRTQPFEMYLPPSKKGEATGGMVAIRTVAPPATLIPLVRDVVRAVDAEVPIIELATGKAQLREVLEEPRALLLLMNVFASVALLLVAIGIYGMVSYTVAQRTREIGIRAALGAPGRAIVYEVLSRSMLLVVAGSAAGAVVALALSQFMTAALFKTQPTDPAALVVAAFAFCAAALVAVAGPAGRAWRVAPTEALRLEL